MSSSSTTLDINNYLRLLFAENADGFLTDYKKLADLFPALVFILDAKNNRLAYTNKQFRTLLGYTEEELGDIECNWHRIIYQDDIENFNRELEKCSDLKEDYSHTFNTRLNHRDGFWKYFRTQATVLQRNMHGNADTLLLIAHDITEQMLESEELKRSKQLIRETEKMHHLGTYSYDIANDRFSWSDGIYNLLDINSEDYPSPDYDFFRKFIVPEDRQRMPDIRENISKDTSGYENVFSIQTKNGDIKILLDIVKILRNENGEIIKYSGSLRDITREQLSERELRKNIRELNNSNKELEDFAYVASHDMQEPLRKIITFSSRLHDKYSKQLGDEGITYLERMNAAANNMRILIENLLEISKTSRQDHKFKQVNLNETLQDVISELELSIEEKQVLINIAQPLPVLEAVAPLMHQLFANLISNSIKFRSDKQPVINIETRKIDKTRREQLLLPDKSFYEITLTDNGIGFEQEFAERVFQIFQRLHGKVEYPGSGIGLSICRKITEKHNGLIYAESESNKGTKFFIILPEKQ